MNNPGMTKGGKIVIFSGVDYIRSHYFMLWNKLHTMTTAWTVMVQVQVRIMMEVLQPMV